MFFDVRALEALLVRLLSSSMLLKSVVWLWSVVSLLLLPSLLSFSLLTALSLLSTDILSLTLAHLLVELSLDLLLNEVKLKIFAVSFAPLLLAGWSRKSLVQTIILVGVLR